MFKTLFDLLNSFKWELFTTNLNCGNLSTLVINLLSEIAMFSFKWMKVVFFTEVSQHNDIEVIKGLCFHGNNNRIHSPSSTTTNMLLEHHITDKSMYINCTFHTVDNWPNCNTIFVVKILTIKVVDGLESPIHWILDTLIHSR